MLLISEERAQQAVTFSESRFKHVGPRQWDRYRVAMIFVPRWFWSRTVCMLIHSETFTFCTTTVLYCRNVSVPSQICFAQALGDFVRIFFFFLFCEHSQNYSKYYYPSYIYELQYSLSSSSLVVDLLYLFFFMFTPGNKIRPTALSFARSVLALLRLNSVSTKLLLTTGRPGSRYLCSPQQNLASEHHEGKNEIRIRDSHLALFHYNFIYSCL